MAERAPAQRHPWPVVGNERLAALSLCGRSGSFRLPVWKPRADRAPLLLRAAMGNAFGTTRGYSSASGTWVSLPVDKRSGLARIAATVAKNFAATLAEAIPLETYRQSRFRSFSFRVPTLRRWPVESLDCLARRCQIQRVRCAAVLAGS